MCKCKYCDKEFETTRKMISHLRHCKLNPNYEKNIELQLNAAKKAAKSRKESSKNNPANQINEYYFKCEVCGKEYTLHLKEHDYVKGKYRKTCSSQCANSHPGLTKDRTMKRICIKCGEEYEVSIHSRKEGLCNKCKLEQKHILQNSLNLEKMQEVAKKKIKLNKIKDLDKGCLLIKRECYDNCFFYKEGICKKSKSGIVQKLNTLIKYFNFDLNKCIDEEHAKLEYYKIKNAIQEDLDLGLSGNDICIKYTGDSKHGNTVFQILNLNTRNISEAVSLAFIQGKIGVESYKRIGYTNIEGKQFIFRSSYEVDYAKELDEKRIKYEYENLMINYFDTQQNKPRFAIPDFYLPETNTIVEIKSIWTLNKQNMIDKVDAYKKLGYNFKLILEHKETNLFSL